MSTSPERISRWTRRFVIASGLFLLAWTAGTLLGVPKRTEIFLGVFGFVFNMVFAKGYTLIPSYFDRTLASPWLPAIHFPLAVLGTVGLGLASIVSAGALGPITAGTLAGANTSEAIALGGIALWSVGVLVFVGGTIWSVRGNLVGSETATGEHNRHRQSVDRLANRFVPVALAYLLFGTYELSASLTPLPPIFDGYPPRSTHLFAAGTAALLIFAIGFRLLPRFLGASPPTLLVGLVLSLGAIGPLGLAWTLPAGEWLPLFGIVEALAVLGYAAAIGLLFARSKRLRVGMYGVLAGMIAGVFGVGLGLWLAVDGVSGVVYDAHVRLNLLGFLGLTIVGVAYQFYPPSASVYPGGTDRTAAISIGAFGSGLAVELVGLAATSGTLEAIGHFLALVGAVVYLYLLVGVFASRRNRR